MGDGLLVALYHFAHYSVFPDNHEPHNPGRVGGCSDVGGGGVGELGVGRLGCDSCS